MVRSTHVKTVHAPCIVLVSGNVAWRRFTAEDKGHIVERDRRELEKRSGHLTSAHCPLFAVEVLECSCSFTGDDHHVITISGHLAQVMFFMSGGRLGSGTIRVIVVALLVIIDIGSIVSCAKERLVIIPNASALIESKWQVGFSVVTVTG